jgi:hypothetical protein
MQFMLIERFEKEDMIPVYRHIRSKGRQLPDGLTVVASWVEANFGRCFQVMECDDIRLLQAWILTFRGLGVTFEVIPVVEALKSREVAAPFLD